MQADYKMINLLLTGNQVQHSAAELHGLLAGQLCSGVARPDPEELGELLEHHGDLAPVVIKLCERLVTETADQLGQLDFQFQPLLPPDEAELAERVNALGLWCDGFTVGFAAGFIQPEEVLSDEARELLGDLGRLSAVSAEAEDCSEQDEVDYMELVEYVRLAAITLFQQLATPPPHGSSETAEEQSDILH